MRDGQLSLNKEWRFFRGEVYETVEETQFDDTKWEIVTIPHTARVEPAMCSGGINYQGICWYRKRFYIDSKNKDKKRWIAFEGAKHITEVWLNGKKIGTHLGGYTPFTFDISDMDIKTGVQENILVVKLDNTDQPDIPPGKPQDTLDFCYFGGLYRNVWFYETDKLYVTDPVYADKKAAGGIFVTTEYADKKQAEVKVQTHIKNEYKGNKVFELSQALYNQEGTLIAQSIENKELVSGHQEIYIQRLNIKNPILWHPDTPYLYTLKTVLKGTQKVQNAQEAYEEQKIYDAQETLVGIRRLYFDQEGLKINGEPFKVIGANKSQEYVYIGDAVSDTMQEREVRKLKEAGFDCIRTGHYPYSSAFMEACDRVGVLCIVPIPGWQWFKDEDLFKNRCYQNLKDIIRYHRNHPSIMIWEPILNESRYTEEFAKTTYAITHEEYPGDQCYASCDAYLVGAEFYDIPYGNEKDTLASDKCCFIREYGDNYREQYGPQKTIKRCSRGDKGFYPGGEKAMLKSAIERTVQTDRLFLSQQIVGGAIWTSIDCNRGYIGNISAAGVLDLYRFPKFSYYAYQSQRDTLPMVFAATYWQKPIKPLVLFSNCEEIKVYVNGKLKASQKVNRTYLDREDVLKAATHFSHGIVNGVPLTMVDEESKGLKHPPFVFEEDFFEEGTLYVEGFINGKVVATQTLITPSMPKKIRLVLDTCNKELVADGADSVMIHAYIQDTQSMIVPYADNKIIFRVNGPAKIVGDGIDRVGANPIEAEAGAIGVLIQSTDISGEITVIARSEGLEEGIITFKSQEDTRFYVSGPIEEVPKEPIVYSVDSAKVRKKVSFNEFDWAIGRKVVASSWQEGHLPSAICDNLQDTSWRSETDVVQWLIVDLEEKIDLTGCKIWWESDNTDYHYKILVSEDGLEWEQVIDKVGTGQDVKADTFSTNKKRFIKITILEVSKGVPEICSFQVFGIQ